MERRGKHTSVTIEEASGAAPRLYDEDLRQLGGELRESIEISVEDD
jgi:hypothetical protein